MSRRSHVLVAAISGAVLLILPTILKPTPRLLWNASASLPVGLYAAVPVDAIAIGDLVAVQAPEPLQALFAARGYLPDNVPLLKAVRALPGTTVCRRGVNITVNGQHAGSARLADRQGRQLPQWQGCHVLQPDELFLMNDAPDSLDGRYFGPLARSAVVARLVPLWTDDSGSGRFTSHVAAFLKTQFQPARKGSDHASDR